MKMPFQVAPGDLAGRSASLGSSTVHFAIPDLLRATAIIVVVISHIIPGIDPQPLVRSICNALGYWGVDAFFVLSGFLLGLPYVEAVLRLRPMPRTVLYARRRFFRIWPAYACVVLVVTALVLVHRGHDKTSLLNVLAHLAMIHNLSPNLIESGGNVALWTMAVDAQFYVLLPIFAWIVLKLTRPFREELLPFIILGLIGGVVSLSISWRIFAFMSFPGQEVVTSPTLYAVQRGVIGMGMCFALGGLLALARAMTFVIPPATGRALCVCGSSLAAILWTLPLWFPTNLQKEQSTIMDVLGTISVASVLFGAINLHSRVIQSFAGCGVVSIAAANAYALYLVHDPVASAIESTLLSHHMKTGTLRFGFLTIFAFFLFGSAATYALHRYVEQPCLSMKEKAREIATAV